MNHQFFFLSSLAAVLLSLSGCSAPPLPPSADKDGLLLSGSVRTLAVTEFNAIRENGQMIPLDTLTVRTIFFSPDGRIEKVIHENGEEHYFYSSGCRTIKRYNLDGEPDHDEIARYDTQDNMISWGMYGADGTVMSREVYTYCGGRCVEKRIQDGDASSVIVCRDYRYDEAGKQLFYRAYEPDGSIAYAWRCTYDSTGRKEEEQWLDEHDSVISVTRFTYNDHGLIASEQADLYTNTFTYLYDEYGNYTEKCAIPSGNDERLVYTIEERTIVYY